MVAEMNYPAFLLFVLKKAMGKNGLAGPLMCWDIFMDGYNKKMARLASLQELKNFVKKKEWLHSWNLEERFLTESNVILITSTSLKIEFASSNITDMNGYEPKELIGQSPKVFQGKDTSVETRKQIRQAIIKRIPFSGSILNYRKDGSTYDCLVEEYPVWNRGGALVNFIAFEKVA